MKNNPLVSVIIPTKNSSAYLDRCLSSIKKQSYRPIEIIIVDNNSSDRTKSISRNYTKSVYNKEPERSAQRNFGASKARGKYILFIDSDMHLSKNVIKSCVETYQNSNAKNKSAIIIPEKSIGSNFWAKCKALERSFYIGIDWIEAPRFFPKDIFKKFKGFDLKQTGTEDYDLPQRIKTKLGNESILRIKNYIFHDEGKLSLAYTLKKKFYYVQTINVYKNKKGNKTYYDKQSNIFERYKLFFSNPKRLFKNPFLGIGMLFMKTAEFTAGGIGYILHQK